MEIYLYRITSTSFLFLFFLCNWTETSEHIVTVLTPQHNLPPLDVLDDKKEGTSELRKGVSQCSKADDA